MIAFIELCEYSPRERIRIRVDSIVSWHQRTNGGIADGSIVEYAVGQEARKVAVIEQPEVIQQRLLEAATLADR